MKNTWLWVGAGLGVLYVMGKGGVASTYSLVTYAQNAGFSGVDLVTAVAVAMAESGGDPHALGDIDVPQPGSASYGLWQINSYWHPEYGPDFTQLYDPQTNANAAYAIYRQAGGFSPWSAFKNGSYSQYLNT